MAAVNVSVGASFSASGSAALTVASILNVSALATFSCQSSAELEVVDHVKLGGSPSFRAVSSAGLQTVSNVKVSARTAFSASSTADLQTSSHPKVSAAPRFSASSSASLSLSAVGRVSAYAGFRAFAECDLTGASDTDGLSVCDVVDSVLSMWGILCRKSAPNYAIDRAISDLNSAMQLIWNNAEDRDYWTNETLTITLSDGESSFGLPDDIQNVKGPCRIEETRQPLTHTGTLSDLESFADLYLDGEISDVPLAYHIERAAQSGDDPAGLTFHVNQAIDGDDVAFLLDVVKEAPRYTVADLSACPVVPIPHQYVESLLLPVARQRASTFYLFRNEEARESIEREYLQARIALGLADPLPGDSGDSGDKKPKGGAS